VRLVVIGGGIAALRAHRGRWSARVSAAAARARHAARRPRPAGWHHPDRSAATGSYLVECGPDSFISDKAWALDLCRRLRSRTPRRHQRSLPHRLRRLRVRLHPLPRVFSSWPPTRLSSLLRSSLFSLAPPSSAWPWTWCCRAGATPMRAWAPSCAPDWGARLWSAWPSR
jgi:oxygen-dependent protoporphyrinogen oxidase